MDDNGLVTCDEESLGLLDMVGRLDLLSVEISEAGDAARG
jgi:hypothetical protein